MKVFLLLSGLAVANASIRGSFGSTLTNASASAFTSPCGMIRSSWAVHTATNSSPTVPADLAYQCLNSVPLQKDSALEFLDALLPYLEWQSDTEFKKHPPKDYFYPPYDFWAELARIKDNVATDVYLNEYEWHVDLYNTVIGPGHDGHFVIYTDVLTNAIEWQRPWALISISKDGELLPQIQVHDDSETGSVVSYINGVDAAMFIANWVFRVSSNQDPDAAYNSMFFSKANNQSGNRGFFSSGGRMRYVYPGPTTTLTFANGTNTTLPNIAKLKGDWSNISDGISFLETFAPGTSSKLVITTAVMSAEESLPPTTTNGDTYGEPLPSRPHTSSEMDPVAIQKPGYPAPYLISHDGIVSGYFIEDGLETVAVLVITSFAPDDPPEFQQIVETFLQASVNTNTTTIIVDLQANGGGFIVQGFDTFRQFFPDVVQNSTGRWRLSTGLKTMADITSPICADSERIAAESDLISLCEFVWNWRYDLDIHNQNFDSFEDKFGSTERNSPYINLLQVNLSNPLDTSNSTFGLGYNVTGYGDRTNFQRPFKDPRNVVLLLDGYCASTCALFARLMAQQAGVKTIAMGGRPMTGPIQDIGGVKGSQSMSFARLFELVNKAKQHTNDSTRLSGLNRYSDTVFQRATTLNLNVKDEILPRNPGVPAQYIVENADCRLYWTRNMHQDIMNLWKAVAVTAFKGGNCAFGGFGINEGPPNDDLSKEVRATPLEAYHVDLKTQHESPNSMLKDKRMVVID